MLAPPLKYIEGVRSQREERGTRAVLNISRIGNWNEQTWASLLPTQQTTVTRDARSLLCHVGLQTAQMCMKRFLT